MACVSGIYVTEADKSTDEIVKWVLLAIFLLSNVSKYGYAIVTSLKGMQKWKYENWKYEIEIDHKQMILPSEPSVEMAKWNVSEKKSKISTIANGKLSKT